MREIKFKGKRIDNGEWVYGYYVKSVATHYITLHNATNINERYDGMFFYGDEVLEIDPTTLGQYTGLKDKNDKEIYEGDRLGEDNYKLVVVFRDGKFHPHYDNGNAEQYESYDYRWYRDLEVTGNIHENKELLDNE